MANTNYFVTNDKRNLLEKSGTSNPIPMISTELDSVRAYQWELNFRKAATKGDASVQKPLTLAAKQVNGIGMSVEDIEVNRVNDKVYYPGRPSMEELVVTFDNLAGTQVDKMLYEFFTSTYDPRTGVLGSGAMGGQSGDLKSEVDVFQLNADGTLRNQVRLLGCYPKNITHGEYNYSTNEFHTLEVTFRYDFFYTSWDDDDDVSTTMPGS